ncbi:uncharacterized protein LOC130949037 [Arachis stenosperma]|uniref:uncharacterized protein LOC130949037 n=1 Tax=Arachis stenosperma TaxID=217475 RepID=UPI0025ABB3DB|nr:uncharacterized protein LOC130949037 [Arachis stenosperma]
MSWIELLLLLRVVGAEAASVAGERSAGKDFKFVVSVILSFEKGKTQYMLKWAGWKDISNTWETQESLHHMRDYVNDFDARIKSRIRENLKKRNKHQSTPSQASSRPFIANPSPLFSESEEESEEEEEEDKDEQEEKEEKEEKTKDDKEDSDYDVNVKVSPGVRRPIARTCKNVKNKSHESSCVDNPVCVSSEEEDSDKEDCNVNIASTPLQTLNRRLSHDDGKEDNAQPDPEEHILANPQIVLFADPI